MQKDYNWNPSTCICENSKYLKRVTDTSVTECDEVITVMDNVSTKKTNTIATKKTNTLATNITSTVSTSGHSKKVRLLYFTDSFISDYITVNNYFYLLSLCKIKRYNMKWKIMNLKNSWKSYVLLFP